MSQIFTNCLCCGQFVMTSGYEAFYCASKRDTGNIIKADKVTYDEIHTAIREGKYVGCGACLIPYRSGNLHRTRRCIVSESELNDIVKKYNPEILAKRVKLRSQEASSSPSYSDNQNQTKHNHANQFTEEDPIDIPTAELDQRTKSN